MWSVSSASFLPMRSQSQSWSVWRTLLKSNSLTKQTWCPSSSRNSSLNGCRRSNRSFHGRKEVLTERKSPSRLMPYLPYLQRVCAEMRWACRRCTRRICMTWLLRSSLRRARRSHVTFTCLKAWTRLPCTTAMQRQITLRSLSTERSCKRSNLLSTNTRRHKS